jgi:post-segregation antitoxin (ccd killing protein)
MTEQEKAEKKRAYMREYARKRRASDPAFLESCREAGRKSQAKRRATDKDTTKLWREKNKEKIAEYNKQYSKENYLAISAKRKEKDQTASLLKAKEWKSKNKEKLAEYAKIYTNKKYHSDPIFRLKMNQRTRARLALKGKIKSSSTEKLLGCTFEKFKLHIESKFCDGMNWENMGQWHIDHIIPLASFDLSKEDHQKIAFHYTNQQPLWAVDNLKKGAKYG